ncbi:DUF885 domain-containing protein [Aliidiomarina haloalkalitolerans]|uniref:DUF885 domain-containing protein n=2 Tax=Aliidiomarina haloalkalitolerans TaxID=859059 RepID=A0A432VZJ1_9GAMM|nr:DUF885 domain-containing protein [Aliidiomarina haloalkalitolerans]
MVQNLQLQKLRFSRLTTTQSTWFIPIAFIVALIFVVACSPRDTSAPSGSAGSPTAATLTKIYDAYFQANLELNPLQATLMGQGQQHDRLPDVYSEEHRYRQRMLEEEYLAAVERIDPAQLSESDYLTYQLFRRDRRVALEQMQFPEHLIPMNQFYNAPSQLAVLGSGTGAQPFGQLEHYAQWERRMRQIPQFFAGIERNMRQGIEQDVVLPAVVVQRLIDQVRTHAIATEDYQSSIFWQPLLLLPETLEASRTELSASYQAALQEAVLPAYRALADFLEFEYLPAARTDEFGIGTLPNGKAWYEFAVRFHTTTNLTADEIHAIGLSEVARLHDAIGTVMDEVDFTGTLAEFFAFTRDDPQFHYATREEMLADYRAFAAAVEERTERLFFAERLPRAGYEIRKVEEFRERSASSGSYSVPSEDGSRPGIFYLNTYDLPARPTWAKGALTLHEAIPGHHYQLALQREMEHLPPFRRYGVETAFNEGWGLYAESLGDELGVYESYDRYGQYIAELWRAIRLVVDTGIHAYGWSRQDVLDYMYANAPVQEARAVSEAERFMALPGQALAYKIGQLHIQGLRDKAEAALGDDFDVREFHWQVLRHGALPLELLSQQIDAWVLSEGGDGNGDK